MADPILPTACDFHGKCRDLLHAANLRHGTDGFTSPPKEGMLKIFSPEKSGGFSRVWTRELGYPLDHWSRWLSADWIITFLQEARIKVLGIAVSVNKQPGYWEVYVKGEDSNELQILELKECCENYHGEDIQ
jgi:hypothetical protein